jgi:glutamine cyclotransferase
VILGLLAALIVACAQDIGARPTIVPSPSVVVASRPARVPACSFEVVNEFSHDPDAYTQGLVFHEGRLYESTGLNGRSSLREVELETGAVLRRVDVAAEHFAEGITILDEKVYQLTWQSRKGFVYDLASFELQAEFAYEGEGWGLTHDGQQLIMSDGSARIRFLDPNTFAVVRTIDVYADGQPVQALNELEYIDGEIYANVLPTDRIARIDPQSGQVVAWLDLAGLLRPENRTPPPEVLNGIARDAETDRLFVTGKFWPQLYEIRLKSAVGAACSGAGGPATR